MERPVGQIFTGIPCRGGEPMRAQVVYIKTLALDEVPCRHCLKCTAKEFLDPLYDAEKLVESCLDMIHGEYHGSDGFGLCKGRIYNYWVCFIDPDDFNPYIHGVVSTDDPKYIGVDLNNKRSQKFYLKSAYYKEDKYIIINRYWRHYHIYFAEKGKDFEFRGRYADGSLELSKPITEAGKRALEIWLKIHAKE